MTTAFVLAGGASLGAIEVGMLGVLYERGISPDLIVGTSAGALNGAFIASRPQTVATADALGELWRGLRRGQVFPFRPLSGLLGFAGTRNHLVLGEPLRQLVARHLQVARLEEMAIPCTSSPSTRTAAHQCASRPATPWTPSPRARRSPACCRPCSSTAGC